jgi:hypothetical protein
MSGNLNYPYSYPLKMLIWISVFVFVFNMDVFKSVFQYYPYSTLSELFDKNLTYMTLFISAKNKVPIKTIKNSFIVLNTNYQ